MIVGRGLLAEAFRARYEQDPSVVILAAGVSNSSETSSNEFQRERHLVEANLVRTKARFVYFSSCIVGFDHLPPTPYVLHKAQMEKLVLGHPGGFVFRLPQVVGRTPNARTLTNYLASHIIQMRELTIFDGAERNLVDVDDVAAIASELLEDANDARSAVPITARHPVAVTKLVSMLEEVLGIKAIKKIEARNEAFQVDADAAWHVADRLGLGLDKGDHYTRRVLQKYYG